MPDNTNVNANSAVTVVGRTAPVPPGQQKSEKSIPVVIASDQSTIPVAEQNKVQSEVALSLLGIPRSEVALGIFADVNTYDVNPTEWTSTPEQFATVGATGYSGIGGDFGWGLTHVPAESGALVEAPPDRSAILTSKRFFRYQPGRVSSATFGVKTTTINSNGVNVQNPCVRKYGIFDNYDGYYWETRNDGQGDNFCVVRRSQANTFVNPVEFTDNPPPGQPGQTDDYGVTNPYDPLEKRASESVGTGGTSVPVGYTNRVLGDLVIIRDKLMMTHAGVYDESLLQPKHKVGISSLFDNNVVSMVGLANSITDAVYNNETGLMTITTENDHGYKNGKFLTVLGIGMTCQYSDVGSGNYMKPKYYPDDNTGYNVVRVDSPNSFTINVGVSTVPTFYEQPGGAGNPKVGGGYVIGLSTDQYISYEKGSNTNAIGGLTDERIYKVANVGVNTITGISTASLVNLDGSAVTGLSNNASVDTGHSICTPVPFIQPVSLPGTTLSGKTKYTSVQTGAGVTSAGTGMFPYLYEDDDGNSEGYIKTDRPTSETAVLKAEVDAVNNFYRKWVNQNVDIEYWGVYEYRVPRSRFSGDRLDNLEDKLRFSDAVADKRAGSFVTDANTGEILTDVSIWDLAFDKVTMYKVEFSWYGAVGALFLAYVPVSNGEARWVRVHHLRASNQLKVSSLGNATLPITYMVYGGGSENRFGYLNTLRTGTNFDYGSASEHIIKYGASYYIDGGDRGTVKLFSHGTPQEQEVYGLKRIFEVGTNTQHANLNSAIDTQDPFILAGSTSGLSTTYYIGAKVITSDPLDQNIEITYVNTVNNRLYLNSPLNKDNTGYSQITVIPNRVTPLVGIQCRDFIQSSTGRNVRNRTQVYPTRLSTGSDAVIKVDLLKTPLFQTNSVIVRPSLGGLRNGQFSLTSETNIGKRGKPTAVPVPLSTYTGAHTYVEASTTKTAAIKKVTGGATLNIASGSSAVAYNSSTGIITLTTSSAHNLNPGNEIRVLKEALAFTCDLDGNTLVKVYPRVTDPIFDGNAPGGQDFNGTIDGDYSRPITLRTASGTTMTFSVTTDTNNTSVPSAAEYIRDLNGGAYGYFRGRFETDATNKPISVLGYLENRGKDRTKNIDSDDYYFYALNATTDNIILNTTDPFIREEDADAEGNSVGPEPPTFTLAQLSSIKVAPQLRSPIPKTGTIVASLFIPGSGENYDLSPYFDFNKEYLSFPLTNVVDSLYICGSSQKSYMQNTSVFTQVGVTTDIPVANVSASLTWEEQ